MNYVTLSLVLMIICFRSFAQVPNSLDPGTREASYAPLRPRSTNEKRTSHVETEKEYVARMKKTVRLIRRQERLAKRPQYSNPLYFGHRRPPKKNRAGQLKFCRECGIRH